MENKIYNILLVLILLIALSSSDNYVEGAYTQKEMQFADSLFVDKLKEEIIANSLDFSFSTNGEYLLWVSDFCNDLCCLKLQNPAGGLNYDYNEKAPLEFICAGKITTKYGTFYIVCHPLSYELNKHYFSRVFKENGAVYEAKYKRYEFKGGKLTLDWVTHLRRYCDDIYVFKYNYKIKSIEYSNTEYPCE